MTIEIKFAGSPADSLRMAHRSLRKPVAKTMTKIRSIVKKHMGDALDARNLPMRYKHSFFSYYKKDDQTLTFATLSPLMASIEAGGEVRAMSGKALAIPLQPVDKHGNAIRLSAKWDRSGMAKLFPIRTRAGHDLLVKRSGREIIPMFVLKDYVTIRKIKPFLGDTWTRSRAEIQAMFEAELAVLSFLEGLGGMKNA